MTLDEKMAVKLLTRVMKELPVRPFDLSEENLMLITEAQSFLKQQDTE